MPSDDGLTPYDTSHKLHHLYQGLQQLLLADTRQSRLVRSSCEFKVGATAHSSRCVQTTKSFLLHLSG